MKWGDNPRDFDVPLAIWPVPDRAHDTWWMQELIAQSDGSVKWRDRRVPTESGNVRLDIHRELASAMQLAETLDPLFAAKLVERD
jgi:hypothetical protein